jgi:DNA-binding beta-propeller fold protein YncE
VPVFLRSFDSGNISRARSVDADPEGRVYVADTDNHRVVVFDGNGSVINSWGRQGSNSSEFQLPQAVVYSEDDGLVYVADSGNNRVQIFFPNGTFVRSFETLSNAENTWHPNVIALGDNLTVYVASGPVIGEYNSIGQLLHRYGGQGSGPGQFGGNVSGLMYARRVIFGSDFNNSRVNIFSGGNVTSVGSRGTNDDQFNGPMGLANDDTHVYVADSGNNRITIWNLSNGEVVDVFTGDGNTTFNAPMALAINQNNSVLYVTEAGSGRVLAFNLTAAPNANITTNSTTPSIVNFTYAARFGDRDAEPPASRLLAPSGLAVADDQLFVCDFSNHRVVVFNTSRAYVTAWGGEGVNSSQFKFPLGLAVYADHVYVADNFNNRVQIFTQNGTFIRAFPTFSNATIGNSTAIAVGHNSTVYVASAPGLITVYNSTDHLIRSWPANANLSTHMNATENSSNMSSSLELYPANSYGLALYNDTLFASDYNNSMVRAFNASTGDLISAWNLTTLTNFSGAVRPAGIALREGQLWIADIDNNRIIVCDVMTGTVRAVFTNDNNNSNSEGTAQFNGPFALAFGSSVNGTHTLFVSETRGDQLHQFSFNTE